ncbi:hypothetical protein DER72_103120 [Halomonas sp. A11-A]|jgi:hypothetical protein|nr:hypothetical protein DER72_103120 [Halomonas sp. A11-A]
MTGNSVSGAGTGPVATGADPDPATRPTVVGLVDTAQA